MNNISRFKAAFLLNNFHSNLKIQKSAFAKNKQITFEVKFECIWSTFFAWRGWWLFTFEWSPKKINFIYPSKTSGKVGTKKFKSWSNFKRSCKISSGHNELRHYKLIPRDTIAAILKISRITSKGKKAACMDTHHLLR